MLKSHIAAVAAAAALAAWPLASAEPLQDDEYRIVVALSNPLAVECYENARDEKTGAEAIEPCDKSLESESLTSRRQAVVRANRGVILYNSGAYDEAVDDFTISLDLGIFVPARILTNRALAYEALRYDNLARADYQRALLLNSGEERARLRLEEMKKPYLERSKVPRKISVEAPAAPRFSS